MVSLAIIHGSQEPPIVLLDHLLGFRAWGLILYGTLPANLVLIGALKVDDPKAGGLILPILAILPLTVTFLLIRHRQKEWYLSSAFLNFRSLVITVLILLFSMAIYGAAQIVSGRFVFQPTLRSLIDATYLPAYQESFIFGVTSLTLSSTIFIALLTKPTDLPGLPSSASIDTLTKIRKEIRFIQEDRIWKSHHQDKELRTSVNTLATLISNVAGLGLPSFARRSLEPLHEIARNFSAAIEEIDNSPSGSPLQESYWKIYFAPESDLSQTELDERQHRSGRLRSLRSISETRWGN